MSISKYDFKGIKKMGATGIRTAIASNPSLSWTLKIPFFKTALEMLVNWFANEGLIIMNIGAIYVNGEINQAVLDRAIDAGIKKVESSDGKLTPQQIKEIDDAVIKAANRALPYKY